MLDVQTQRANLDLLRLGLSLASQPENLGPLDARSSLAAAQQAFAADVSICEIAPGSRSAGLQARVRDPAAAGARRLREAVCRLSGCDAAVWRGRHADCVCGGFDGGL